MTSKKPFKTSHKSQLKSFNIFLIFVRIIESFRPKATNSRYFGLNFNLIYHYLVHLQAESAVPNYF